jgi:hypothetical protein
MVRKAQSDDEDLDLRDRVLVALGVLDPPEVRFNKGELRLPKGAAGGGRWTKGGAAGAAVKDAVKDAEDDIADATKEVTVAVDNLFSGKNATISGEHLGGLLDELRKRDAVNLAHLDVTGKGNENLFTKHVRDIPRSAMPQLPANVDGIKPFMDELAKRGINAKITQRDPRTMVMTQSELDSKKVAKLAGFMQADGWQEGGILLMSTDGSILDGHHRWAGASAAVAAGKDMKVTALEIDLPIDPLLEIAQTMSGPRVGLGTENNT